MPKIFIFLGLIFGNLAILVKFDIVETKKTFAVGENCGNFTSEHGLSGWNKEGVYLYEHDSFKGRCTLLNWSDGNAWNWYVGNDHISSIGIIGSWEVTVFENQNYTGISKTFKTWETNEYSTKVYASTFLSANLNDKISSIKIETKSNCAKGDVGVYFYSGTNYTGRCTMLPMRRNITGGGNYFQITNFSNWFVGNDAIQSV